MNNQNWPNQGWQNQYNWQRPSTNVLLVTSIDEALMKSNDRNSDYVYFHQDKSVFYRVKVDNDGRKVWQEFNYSSPNPQLSVPVTQADLIKFNERLTRLETLLEKEVTTNVQSNG